MQRSVAACEQYNLKERAFRLTPRQQIFELPPELPLHVRLWLPLSTLVNTSFHMIWRPRQAAAGSRTRDC